MVKENLDEREFELINIIGKKMGSNQRDLSRYMDLSLGQTNMLIRRLISKGLIRISQLNKRKVQYLLTPKGMAEKMKKSVKYTVNTINSIGLINKNLKLIIQELYDQGEKNFFLLGNHSDFVMLVEMILRDIFQSKEYEMTKLEDWPEKPSSGLILVCQENFPEVSRDGHRFVDLVRELAKAHDEAIQQIY